MSQSVSTASSLETVSTRKASDIVIAYTILRLSFGANILLHGLSRILNGRPAFLAYLTHYFEHAHLISPGMLPVFGAICGCSRPMLKPCGGRSALMRAPVRRNGLSEDSVFLQRKRPSSGPA